MAASKEKPAETPEQPNEEPDAPEAPEMPMQNTGNMRDPIPNSPWGALKPAHNQKNSLLQPMKSLSPLAGA